MGINDSLGAKGIFISNNARSELNIKLSEDEFERLKQEVKSDNDPEEFKKCFITNQMVKVKDGLMLSPEWMADALEKVLESKEKLEQKYKNENVIICGNCGSPVKADSRMVTCEKCQHQTNVKVYAKSIKLPFAKKISFKLYIKFLRGKA